MPRFFVNNINENNVIIDGNDALHIRKSLRMNVGDVLTVCCNGIDYSCEISEINTEKILLKVLFFNKSESEPNINLTLYQAIPKSDKLELIIQKAVELGANQIVPVLTRRCISRPSEKDFQKKLLRYNKIAESASKQAGRAIIPQVLPMINYSNAIEAMKKDDVSIVFYESGGLRLNEMNFSDKKNISIMIGSEGGFDDLEISEAQKNGIETVWLGNRILRCETAPITAISLLMHLTGNL
jgi:16S rRNA (uracil1498-N3)-methyltransferase